MKQFRSQLTLAAALVATSAVMPAQTTTTPGGATVSAVTQTIVGGRTTINLSTSLLSQLADSGVALTDLRGLSPVSGRFTFAVKEGVVDLNTAQGEVSHENGFLVESNNLEIRIQNLVLDTTNVAQPLVTATFTVNGSYQGRIPLFSVILPSNIFVPFVPQGGTVTVNNFGFLLTSSAASTINKAFGASVFSAGQTVGSGNVYVVLAGNSYLD